jgi:hypothetical protein
LIITLFLIGVAKTAARYRYVTGPKRTFKMAERSIPEQIIDEFIGEIARQKTLEPKKLFVLDTILRSEKPKKAEILLAIRGDD